MAVHSGQCLCGAVKYTAASVDTHFHACHCGMCRRWAAGPMMAARADGVEFVGVESLSRFRSSEWAERGFCNKCGSSPFYFLVPANQYFMSVGSFKDSSTFTMTSEIFIDHKPSAYEFAGNRTKLTEADVLAQWS